MAFLTAIGPVGHETLSINGREIVIALVRNRRARRYVLRLRADGSARLTIPRSGSAAEAWQFARHQCTWLDRQLELLSRRPIRPAEWRIGTGILFRGELFKIEAVSLPNPAAGSLAENLVRLGELLVPVANSAVDLRPAIEKHLRSLAAAELPERTVGFAALHRLSVRRVTVRAQRTRWGSCSSNGVISLNWRLVQTPPFVRDYIILHELMHLRQMNHSARFWREVERACPNYRTAKRWLKENPGLLDRP